MAARIGSTRRFIRLWAVVNGAASLVWFASYTVGMPAVLVVLSDFALLPGNWVVRGLLWRLDLWDQPLWFYAYVEPLLYASVNLGAYVLVGCLVRDPSAHHAPDPQ